MDWKKVILVQLFGIIVILQNEEVLLEMYENYTSYMWRWKSLRDGKNNDLFYLPAKYRRPDSKAEVVLYWKPIWENIPPTNIICPGYVMTYDRSAIDIAVAVVFHFREAPHTKQGFPLKERNPKQIWIWFCQESPGSTLHGNKLPLTPLNGIFNWTMSYRADSDVYIPYGSKLYLPYMAQSSDPKDIMMKKTETSLGIAVISNCAFKRRIEVLNEISKHIPIDLYGNCWSNPLCGGECQKQKISGYKFYFAFENSLCKDYVTEKFWKNSIHCDVVPVVMGASRAYYEMIAPKDSFIYVDDFHSIKELANYLKLLSENDQLYLAYFKWKENLQQETNILSRRTDIPKGLRDSYQYKKVGIELFCEKLKHRDRNQRQVISNLDTWWYGESYTPSNKNTSTCKELGSTPYYVLQFEISIYCVVVLLPTILYIYIWSRRRKFISGFGHSAINATRFLFRKRC